MANDRQGDPVNDISKTCPHCNSKLVKWNVPVESSWTEEFFYACFNDECPYFKNGWDHMKKNYQQHASYRYAISPDTGSSLMIPVWSSTAARNLIDEDSQEG